MTAADQNLVIRVLDALTEMGPIDTRPYFGGTAFVADGHQFAFAMGNELYLAVDDRTRPEVEAFGAEPFRYHTRTGMRTVMAYYRIPTDIVVDGEVLAVWASRALATRRLRACPQ